MGSSRQVSFAEDDTTNKKKRGRRKLEDDQYYSISNEKIQEWENLLQNSQNLSKKDKKILRNRISAQKSRNKKKEEFGVLTSQIEILTNKYQDLYEVIDCTLCSKCKDQLAINLSQAQMKRQKLDTQSGIQAGGKPNLKMVLFAFLAVIGVLGLASQP